MYIVRYIGINNASYTKTADNITEHDITERSYKTDKITMTVMTGAVLMYEHHPFLIKSLILSLTQSTSILPMAGPSL